MREGNSRISLLGDVKTDSKKAPSLSSSSTTHNTLPSPNPALHDRPTRRVQNLQVEIKLILLLRSLDLAGIRFLQIALNDVVPILPHSP